jgi:4-hydroxy-tetrahydrodipicolinate synthase
MLNGYLPAVVTPFKEGEVDLAAFERYAARLVNSGVSAIVVCGSTGESLTLSSDEKIQLVKTAASVSNGKVKIIAGIIETNTASAVSAIKSIENFVDAFLCICPFYIKPSQEQIYNHFKTLSESTKRNIILYNNPGRVGTSIALDTLKRLGKVANIIGIKECTSDLSVFTTWRACMNSGFLFFSGNDDTACSAIAAGAAGVISVSANIAPEACTRMYASFIQGNNERFGVLRDLLAPLHQLMFEEPTPGPVKYALSKFGLIKNELRMPLSPVTKALEEKIDALLKELGSGKCPLIV